MIVHATPEDLADAPWYTTADEADRLLYSASLLVDAATVTAVYDVDDTGTPTDTTVLTALRDATCAQAATWAALGIDPAKGAADEGTTLVASKSIGSGQITYDRSGRASTAQARARAADRLAADAQRILAAAGLTSTGVRLYG